MHCTCLYKWNKCKLTNQNRLKCFKNNIYNQMHIMESYALNGGKMFVTNRLYLWALSAHFWLCEKDKIRQKFETLLSEHDIFNLEMKLSTLS